MNNQEENNWYAIQEEISEGEAHYARDTGALKPMNNYNPMKESGADYFARTQKQEFEPQTIQQRPSSEMPEPFQGEIKRDFEPFTFEGPEFEDNYIEPLSGEDLSNAGPDTATYQNEPGNPSGSFTYGGVNYVQINGKYVALKPDGTPMNPGEMFQHTDAMSKKPGHMTGKPLLPSKLFQKPPKSLAQR